MKRLSLANAVAFYLQQRRQLGFPLKEDGQMLHQLVGYASERGHRGPLTNQMALAWAQAPTQASRLWWARRLDAARRLLRIGEALRLHEEDIDWTAGLLTVRHSKLRRSRCLPLQASTLTALNSYRQKRQKHLRQTDPTPLFVGPKGRAITYVQAAQTFRCLRQGLGWNQQPVPRLHDLRHSFAVGSLMDWYRQGDAVAQKVLCLATYLGHSSIQGTYWYLSAVPELLALAQARWRELSRKPGGSHA